MYSTEEFDKSKTKILKYIMYKKRTEKEVRKKFENEFEEEMLNDVIKYLIDAGYINDSEYIERTINNFKLLKSMSMTELKYKLMEKGLDKNLIEDYWYNNKEELTEYEVNSAIKIIGKKIKDNEEIDIRNYLIRKGYRIDSINRAFEEMKVEE